MARKIFLALIICLLLGCSDDDDTYQITPTGELVLPEKCCENGLKIFYEDDYSQKEWICDNGVWELKE